MSNSNGASHRERTEIEDEHQQGNSSCYRGPDAHDSQGTLGKKAEGARTDRGSDWMDAGALGEMKSYQIGSS
jgi:hypothetical protein